MKPNEDSREVFLGHIILWVSSSVQFAIIYLVCSSLYHLEEQYEKVVFHAFYSTLPGLHTGKTEMVDADETDTILLHCMTVFFSVYFLEFVIMITLLLLDVQNISNWHFQKICGDETTIPGFHQMLKTELM